MSSTDFNLNVWEGYTNDIKQDLAENKSWLKVVCMCRNINMSDNSFDFWFDSSETFAKSFDSKFFIHLDVYFYPIH